MIHVTSAPVPSTPAGPQRLSTRALQASASIILAINARARDLIARGQDVVLFGAGEPDFPTPGHIVEATRKALADGMTRYTASNGIADLRAAIASGVERDLKLTYRPEEVIVTTGAKMALFEVLQATCEPGDEVLLLAPYWTSYAEMVVLAGARPVVVPARSEDAFLPDPDRIRAALTPRTRAIILNAPGNPTGAVYPRETLEQLARVLAPTNILVISDDIYEKILFDGRRFANIAQLGPEWQARTVVVNGASKAYSMTGFRIGWALGPREIIAAMGRIQDQSTSNPASFAQAGALAALTGPQDEVRARAAEFERRRDAMVGGLRSIPGLTCTSPGGAFYAFPSVAGVLRRPIAGQHVRTPTELAELLLDRFGLAVVPGEPFAAPEHLRLSFATSQAEIARGLARLGEALAEVDG